MVLTNFCERDIDNDDMTTVCLLQFVCLLDDSILVLLQRLLIMNVRKKNIIKSSERFAGFHTL